MAKLLDQILVVDVESTCWEGGQPPRGQISEIIEIGLCVVDVPSLEQVGKRSMLVRPARSQVSAFCTQLTTLTAADLETAGSFADAAHILKKEYRAKERLWASWGDYDRRQFERVCAELGVGYPFGLGHVNVKTLFAAAMGLDRELGLDAAFDKLGLTMEGTHHRGVDDACNIAVILCRMLKAMRGG